MRSIYSKPFPFIYVLTKRCPCRAKYGVVEDPPAAPSKDNNDSNKDTNASENKSSAALSALGGYGSDSDSDSPKNE